MNKIYIAAPFFTEKQLEFVKQIENCLEENGFDYFSPRKEGVITKLDESERTVENLKRIYDSNILNMEDATSMIAVIDDNDVGTMFELGYFTKKKNLKYYNDVRIITMTNNDYGLNVMLKFDVDCHLKSIYALSNLLEGVKAYGAIDKVFEHWNTNPEVNT